MRKSLEELRQEISPPDQHRPEALDAFGKAETEKWRLMIRAADITAQ